MADPRLIVEIGFTAPLTGTALHLGDSTRGILGVGTLAPSNLLTDVSEYVTSVKTRRGATDASGPYPRFEAGTATITFNDPDRRFDPLNLAGPYVAAGVTQVEPMRAVRIRVEHAGVTYPVWRGFTDQWSVAYDGSEVARVTVTCFDALQVFAAQDRGAISAVGAGESTGARIGRILTNIGWPSADRVLAAGVEAVQATTLAGPALTEMLLNADTELGELWMDAQGRVTFRDRAAPYADARSRWPVAHFGDQPSAGDTTINLSPNPSLETYAGGGWVSVGGTPPTLTRSSVRAMFGSWSLLATWGTGGLLPGVAYDIAGLTSGRTYTISVYVWVPTGSPRIDTIVAGRAAFGSSSTVFDAWERLVWTGSATGATMGFGIWPSGSPTAGQQVWIDGLQVEEGTTATAYVDGDQPGCEWDRVAGSSTSRRLPELPYEDLTLANPALSITNQVRAARAGGTEQLGEDPASVSRYLPRTHSRSDLLLQTDLESRVWAEQIVARRSRPEPKVAALRLKPRGSDERVFAQAFGRELGDRLRVTRRPPGGGSPIVRPAWVRGVEHQMGVDMDWESTFTLEQTQDPIIVEDQFGRTVASGWGSADSGEVWTTTGGSASDYAVASGVGRQTLTSASVFRTSMLTVGMANQSLSVDVTVPVLPTGAALTVWMVGRAVDPGTYYTVNLSFAPSGAVTLSIYRRVSNALSGSLGSTSAGTHSAGNTWRLQMGTLGTVIRGRAWRPASDPTPGWTSVVDTVIPTGEGAGLLTRRETGNTNTNPVISFDGFLAEGRHYWD
ncbi:hypothetical protein OHB44_28035 [Micromonospora sp. NBC_00821]|uniref:hypothetical protein n=1 Tax=Micromonospora sp. NBC_00821 TaxID=2975977 RepID=UPI002ED2FFD4|nr:hypothetical protein OHB44_28035 [Micromonospora sp. NBC_00821]